MNTSKISVMDPIPFDELAVLVTCRIYNVHCVILLKNSYWTTRPNSMFHDSILRLAYCGDFAFKEISAELADELSPKSDHESGNESVNEDLQGTGLLETENDTDSDHEEAAANKHSQNEQSIEK